MILLNNLLSLLNTIMSFIFVYQIYLILRDNNILLNQFIILYVANYTNDIKI